MSTITRVLRQKAIYWPNVGYDTENNPLFGPLVKIKCRWDDVSEQFLDEKGTLRMSNASVMVDRDVTIDGVLWLVPKENEDLADGGVTYPDEPLRNTRAHLITKFEKIPDLKARKFLRTAIV